MKKTFLFTFTLLLACTSKVYALDQNESFFEIAQKKVQQALEYFQPEIKIEKSSKIAGPFTLCWQARTYVPARSPQSEFDPVDNRAGRGQETFTLKNLLVLTGARRIFALDRNIPKIVIAEDIHIGSGANIIGESLFYMDSWRKPVHQAVKAFPLSNFLSPAQDSPTDLQIPAKPYFQGNGNLLISQNHFSSNKVRVAAFDISTRRVVWEKEFEDSSIDVFENKPEDSFEHEYLNRLGRNATDVIIGDRYIFSTLDKEERHHYVRALELTTGEVIWEKKIKREIELSILEITGVKDCLLLSGAVFRVSSENPPRQHRIAIALDSRNGKEVGRLEHVWDFKWDVKLAFADENNIYYFADSYQLQAKELIAINWRSGKTVWKNSFNNSTYLKELMAKHSPTQRPFRSFIDYIPLQLEHPDGGTYKSNLVLIHRESGMPHFMLTLGRKTKGSDIVISPIVTSKYLYAASGGVLYAIEAVKPNPNLLYDFAIDFSEDMTSEEKQIQALKNEGLINAFYKTDDEDMSRILKKEILARSRGMVDLLIPHLHLDAKLHLTGAPNTERYRTLRLLANINDARLVDIWRKVATASTHAGFQSSFKFEGISYLVFAYHERLIAQSILKNKYGINIHAPVLELIAFDDSDSRKRFFTKWTEADKKTDFLEAYNTLKNVDIKPHPIEYIVGQLERNDLSGDGLMKWENELNLFLDAWDGMGGQFFQETGIEEQTAKRPVDKLHFIFKMKKDERRDAVLKIKKWWSSIQDSTVIKTPKPLEK